MRSFAVVLLVIASMFPSARPAAAATVPFLSLPVDGDPYISNYVYDAWTLRMGLRTYSNITLGVPYDHSGTDYSIGQGTPIYAAAHGTILSAQDGFADGCNKNLSDGGGQGNNIWIRHDNGFLTAYFHLQPGSVTQFVRQNQVVEAGQQIARSSNTGNTFGGPCGGFHLHFEVRDPSFRVANPYNTDTGFLFLTDPPTKAIAPIRPRCDSTGTPASTIYLPNVTKTLGGPLGWVTPFFVQNAGQAAAAVELSFYRFADGALVSCGKYANIAPGTALADDPNADADLPDNTQFSVVVRSFGAAAVAMVNQGQGSGASTQSASYSGASAGATRVYLPNVTRRFYGYDVPFIVQNMGTVATTASAHFVSFDGTQTFDTTLAIQPGRSGVIDPDYTPGLLDGTQYAVTLSATQPIAVVANAHNETGAPVAYSHNGLAAGANTVYAPYAVKAGPAGRFSPVVVQNTGTGAIDATLAFTPLGGGATQSFILTAIAAGASRAFDPRFTLGTTTPCATTSATCLGAGEFSLRATAPGPIAAVVLPVSDVTAAAYVAQTAPGTHAYLPNVTRSAGDPSGWTTPIILQSVTATSATARWYALPGGALAKTQSLVLAPATGMWIDPRTVDVPDGRYSVVIDANGTLASIVYELGVGGDSAMIYEGFAIP